jgi:hypothetical protein
MSPRDALHKLLDELPEDNLPAVERVLSAFREPLDPVLWSLANAPYDDEGEDSDEERRAVEEARARLDRGEGIPQEELERDLGLR